MTDRNREEGRAQEEYKAQALRLALEKKDIETRLHQAMGALGFPTPDGLPETNLECQRCKDKEDKIKPLEMEVAILKKTLDRFISRLLERFK